MAPAARQVPHETSPKVRLLAVANFISKAIKRPGQLHRDLGVPQNKKIPRYLIEQAAKRGGKVGQRARFAETLEGLRK